MPLCGRVHEESAYHPHAVLAARSRFPLHLVAQAGVHVQSQLMHVVVSEAQCARRGRHRLGERHVQARCTLPLLHSDVDEHRAWVHWNVHL